MLKGLVLCAYGHYFSSSCHTLFLFKLPYFISLQVKPSKAIFCFSSCLFFQLATINIRCNSSTKCYVHYWLLNNPSSQALHRFLLLFHALTLYYYFQWDGSRFSRSCEEKPEASTAVLPIVQGICDSSFGVHYLFI